MFRVTRLQDNDRPEPGHTIPTQRTSTSCTDSSLQRDRPGDSEDGGRWRGRIALPSLGFLLTELVRACEGGPQNAAGAQESRERNCGRDQTPNPKLGPKPLNPKPQTPNPKPETPAP